MTKPERDQTATLLVSCPDRKGLVAALGQLLYGHGVNILDADQHTDSSAGRFFQRIRMDLTELHTDRLLVPKGRDLERLVLSRAVRFHLEDRILVEANKTVVFA